MPSRRKSAHTTKIERVPRFEVYHGESDVDERCGEDGTLDLSMKRIKVEPPDYSENSDASESGAQSKKFKLVESHSTPVETKADTARNSGDDIAQPGEVNESNEPSQDKLAESTAAETRETGPGADVADDATANTSKDHVTSQVALGSPIVYTTSNGQLFTESNAQKVSAVTGQQLFPQTSKGRSMRPFKLYTSNRDLLAGLSTQGAPTLAAYSVPIALAAAPGAVPLAFASMPVVTGAPMIPVTASAASTTATSSAAAMGAGKDAAGSTSTSVATTNATAKSTSATTDVHLMTLATEADKILRERHASGESLEKNSDMGDSAMEADTAEDLSSNGDVAENAVNEEGTVLKIPSLSTKANSNGADETLTLIHKRAVAAAVAASSPHKSKKKRQTLPEEMKDNAYWERRRKNNEAAKRSRDARRAKEDQIAIRAALLEQENIRLKIEVASLKEETAKLRSMLYSNNNS